MTRLGVVLHLFCSGQDGVNVWNRVILQAADTIGQQPFVLVAIDIKGLRCIVIILIKYVPDDHIMPTTYCRFSSLINDMGDQ